MTLLRIKGKVVSFVVAMMLLCGNVFGTGDSPISRLKLTFSADGGGYNFTNISGIVASNMTATSITFGGITTTNWPVTSTANVYTAGNNVFIGTSNTFTNAIYVGGIINGNGSGITNISSANVKGLNTSNWDTVYTTNQSIVLTASMSTNVSMQLLLETYDVVYGRLYVSDTNTTPFSKTATMTFWDNSTRKMGEERAQFDLGLVCVLTTNAISASATNLYIQDSSDFAVNDLIYLMGGIPTNEFARILALGVNNNIILTQPVGANTYAISNGVSRVKEIGGFGMYDATMASNLWLTLSFTNSTTVNLNYYQEYKR